MRLVLAFLSSIALANGARILCVYPVPSLSHQVVYRALTEELARRGHDLVVVTTHPYLPKDRPADNVREIDVHAATDRMWKKAMAGMSATQTSPVKDFHNVVLKSASAAIDLQLDTPELKALIQNKSETFDLLIVECVVRPAFFYTHRFKVPVIGFSSLMGMQYNYEATGTPAHPILYPDMFQKKIGNLTLWDKAEAIYTDLYQRYAFWKSADEENRIGRKHFGEDTPDIRDLVKNMDLLFLNVNPVWDGIRPVPPNVIFVGGLHIKPAKELPEDLKSYLDGCSRGVVYMSLGSNIKSAELPPERVQLFLRVFTSLEYCVLWKWEADDLSGRPDNVRLAKWLPQGDLLRHPNIRAFITQCGLQSTDEAIEAEIPLIGIPFMGDQEKNAQKYEHHGIGVALNIEILTEAALREAIHKVIQDKSYKRNIARLKRLMYDEPMSSLQRAAWWTEYVLRHGGAAHLRSPSATASFADIFALDVLAALVAVTIFLACLVVYALRYLYSAATRVANIGIEKKTI